MARADIITEARPVVRGGVRLYMDPFSADRLIEAQAAYREKFPRDDVVIAAVGLYVDGTMLDGGLRRPIHSIKAVLFNIPADKRYRFIHLLGFIPELPPKLKHQPAAGDARVGITASCLRLALDGLRRASFTGILGVKLADGRRVTVFPVISAFISDLKDAKAAMALYVNFSQEINQARCLLCCSLSALRALRRALCTARCTSAAPPQP
jgi:hypothetical protein